MSGKAISTRIYPPGANTQARVVAVDCDDNRATVTDGEAEHLGLSVYSEAAARAAARKLCKGMGWTGRLAVGWTKIGFVFVFIGRR